MDRAEPNGRLGACIAQGDRVEVATEDWVTMQEAANIIGTTKDTITHLSDIGYGGMTIRNRRPRPGLRPQYHFLREQCELVRYVRKETGLTVRSAARVVGRFGLILARGQLEPWRQSRS